MNNPYPIILVTGGLGFIGSEFINRTIEHDTRCRIINLDAGADEKNISKETIDSKRYSLQRIDLRNRAAVLALFKRYQPHAVVHFAAETHVDRANVDRHFCYETNVLGTINLLDAFKEFDPSAAGGRFCYVSTDEVYGSLAKDGAKVAFTETSPTAPSNPYSASKLAAEAAVLAYHRTFGMDVVITRGSNTYGASQDVSKFIPKLVAAIKNKVEFPLYGDGENRREWMHVSDHAQGIRKALFMGRNGEIYNIGGGDIMSNNDIIKLITKQIGGEKLIKHVKDRPGHDFMYWVDTKKATENLQWKPVVLFENGLTDTVNKLFK